MSDPKKPTTIPDPAIASDPKAATIRGTAAIEALEQQACANAIPDAEAVVTARAEMLYVPGNTSARDEPSSQPANRNVPDEKVD